MAAWESTLREHYGSLEAYLDRHQIDILCLQEVKVTHTRELFPQQIRLTCRAVPVQRLQH